MKRLVLLFMVLSMGLFAQEAMEAEAPAEEMAPADSMGMMEADTMMAAPEEEAMMEEEETVEEMLAEEPAMEEAASPLAGYYVGVKGSYPFFIPESGAAKGTPALVFGGSVITPFGFDLGSISVFAGLNIDYYDFLREFTGISAMATVNAAIVETPVGSVGAQIGVGWLGNSVGGSVGANFGYAIPNVPVVVKPAARLFIGLEPGYEVTGAMYWLDFGLGIEVDLGSF